MKMQLALKSFKLKLCSKESFKGCGWTMASPWTIFFYSGFNFEESRAMYVQRHLWKKIQSPPPMWDRVKGRGNLDKCKTKNIFIVCTCNFYLLYNYIENLAMLFLFQIHLVLVKNTLYWYVFSEQVSKTN